ncbi:MAG: tryptophan--tRNA ligase [Armatimonadetes bacterium]|nr:tryptophan--tRNA ligase [Armatimonadota bacterium]
MAERKPRLLSGHRPTGRLHLGHLEGTLRNWVALQDECECFYVIADWHALTDGFDDTEKLAEYVEEIAVDWLASGLDPDRAVLFVQSHVPQHAELHLLLSMITPLSWLERCPTWKDVLAQEDLPEEKRSYGRLGYPVLQAADILVYRADVVPVGKDQLPHLEITREIARRFNHLYSPVFPEPQDRLSQFPAVPGIDGRKMSKSYNNAIDLADPPDVVREKLRRMFTDPEKLRRGDPGHPDRCPVFALHKIYTASERQEEIDRDCRSGALGCVACKQELADNLLAALAELHERRARLEANRDYVRQVLREGAERAGAVAEETLQLVREAMHLPPR